MGICKMVVDGSDTRKPHSYPRTRSRRRIISWARFVIEGDPDRPARPALTPDDGAPDGEVALLRFDDNDAEARGIATLIQRLVLGWHAPDCQPIVSRRSIRVRQIHKRVKTLCP